MFLYFDCYVLEDIVAVAGFDSHLISYKIVRQYTWIPLCYCLGIYFDKKRKLVPAVENWFSKYL